MFGVHDSGSVLSSFPAAHHGRKLFRDREFGGPKSRAMLMNAVLRHFSAIVMSGGQQRSVDSACRFRLKSQSGQRRLSAHPAKGGGSGMRQAVEEIAR